jgi:hypothetical protein
MSSYPEFPNGYRITIELDVRTKSKVTEEELKRHIISTIWGKSMTPNNDGWVTDHKIRVEEVLE